MALKPSPKPQPIGQRSDGTLIYEQNMSVMPTQNMSMMPKQASKPFTPITTAGTGIPGVGIPGVKGLTTPIAPSVSPSLPSVTFSPERARQINIDQKMVKDTLGLSKVPQDDPHVVNLRDNYKYLEEKGMLQLNDEQSEYIKRFKTKYPDYKNVLDVNLYTKIIQKDKKTFDKYGNIGVKSAGRKLLELPGEIISTIGDTTLDSIDNYNNRMATVKGNVLDKKSAALGGLSYNQAFIGGGTALEGAGIAAMDIIGHVLNLVQPKDEYAISTTEKLGENIASIVKNTSDFTLPKLKTATDTVFGLGTSELVMDSIQSTIEENPELESYFMSALGWTNLLGVGATAKIAGKEGAEQFVKQVVARGPAKWLKRDVSQEIFEAGAKRSLAQDIATAPSKFIEEQVAKLSNEIPEGPAKDGLVNRGIEKIVGTRWKIAPTIKRKIKQETGISAEKFALDNNLVGSDMGESIVRTEAFKSAKIAEKINEVSKWGEAPKTPAQNAMALSLKKNLEGTLSPIEGANDPELIKLLEGVNKFIDSEKTTYDQIDALKSLYDNYNPDGLRWEEGRLVDPVKHQNAAFRRQQVQKMIEDEGERRGIDIRKINKDIQGSHDLIRGLSRREEVLASNNIISLGDTQIAILGSVLGGDISGLGLLLAKKALGAEATTGFLSRKFYTRANENNPLNNLNNNAPLSRVDRFNPTGNAGSDAVLAVDNAKPISQIPVNETPGQNLAKILESKQITAVKALEKLDTLDNLEKAKALEASPRLRELNEANTMVKSMGEFNGDFGFVDETMTTGLARKWAEYSAETKDLIKDGLKELDKKPSEGLAKIQEMNRKAAGLTMPVSAEKSMPIEAPKTMPKVKETPETLPDVVSTPEVVPQVQETPKIPVKTNDQARIQQIKNSIQEGETILRSGMMNGKKLSHEGMDAVRRSIENAKRKIGIETVTSPGADTYKKQVLNSDEIFDMKKTPENMTKEGLKKWKELVKQGKAEFIDGEYRMITKKPSLPMSSRTPVKYSKVDLASEARKYKSAEEFGKTLLYHGSEAPLKGKMHAGEKGVVWMAKTPEIARGYIPTKSTTSYFGSISDEIRPDEGFFSKIAEKLGAGFEDIEKNSRGDIVGFSAKKYIKKSEVQDYLEKLGYQRNTKTVFTNNKGDILPKNEGISTDATLAMYSGKDNLKIKDLRNKDYDINDLRESELLKLQKEGYDGILVNDEAQFGNEVDGMWGISHESYGIFPKSMEKLGEHRVPSTRIQKNEKSFTSKELLDIYNKANK